PGPVGTRAAAQEGHRVEVGTVAPAVLVNPADVLMDELRGGADLGAESLLGAGPVAAGRDGQRLQGQLAVEQGVPGEEDRPHAPGPDPSPEPVAPLRPKGDVRRLETEAARRAGPRETDLGVGQVEHRRTVGTATRDLHRRTTSRPTAGLRAGRPAGCAPRGRG